jgi:hypothetical protein
VNGLCNRCLRINRAICAICDERQPGVLMAVFWTFVYLSFFSAGIMLVLQVQHFGLYPLVGKETFAAYISANNRAAVFPAILAAMVLTLLSIVLLFLRPAFFSLSDAAICLALKPTD